MESKYIYVPQGRAAIMTEATIQAGLLGLYSNEFSSCVLAIFRNETRKSLLYLHADFICVVDQTSSQAIKQLLSDFKKDQNDIITIEFYYRENEADTLRQLYNILNDLNREGVIFSKPKAFTVPSEFLNEGIYASLGEDSTVIVVPTDLNCPLQHHPDEEKIRLIRRIEEFVTSRALQNKTPYAAKTICIFDGVKFSSLLLEYDLRIDCTNKQVSEDMQELEILRCKSDLSKQNVLDVLKIIAKKGAKFADIDRAADLLLPCLVEYFKIVPVFAIDAISEGRLSSSNSINFSTQKILSSLPSNVPKVKKQVTSSIESTSTKTQKEKILTELLRITGNNWSSYTDGKKFWLKSDKISVNQIIEHITGKNKNIGKITKNSAGTTIFIENAQLSSLEIIPTIKSTSAKEKKIEVKGMNI